MLKSVALEFYNFTVDLIFFWGIVFTGRSSKAFRETDGPRQELKTVSLL